MSHPRITEKRPVAIAARALLVLALVQTGLGALVAGLRAGLTYNTFPLMDGQLIPAGLHLMSPWWLNHLESVMTVQFQHRLGAVTLLLAALSFVGWAWRRVELHPAMTLLVVVVLFQFGLGIITLLSGVSLWIAVFHQFTALYLMGVLTRINYRVALK